MLLMTPALGLFYGGMVSSKNVVNTLMLSFMAMCVVIVQWLVVGYSFSFGPGAQGSFAGFYGNLKFLGSEGVGAEPYAPYGMNIPHYAYWWFQLTFAMITPALISGSVIGRMKFTVWSLFVVIWTTVVYDSVAHMSWSAWDEDGTIKMGWLRTLGLLDYAGASLHRVLTTLLSQPPTLPQPPLPSPNSLAPLRRDRRPHHLWLLGARRGPRDRPRALRPQRKGPLASVGLHRHVPPLVWMVSTRRRHHLLYTDSPTVLCSVLTPHSTRLANQERLQRRLRAQHVGW